MFGVGTGKVWCGCRKGGVWCVRGEGFAVLIVIYIVLRGVLVLCCWLRVHFRRNLKPRRAGRHGKV